MAAFDAPTREQCTVRRERTNTPLQALVLLNDPQYVEAARHLAEHTIKSAKVDKTRAEWMLQKTLSKPAGKEDLSDILELVAEFKALFKEKPEAAKSLIQAGDSQPSAALAEAELAAWTMAANVLMNRDDFINKN